MSRYFNAGEARAALALCILAVAGAWLGWFFDSRATARCPALQAIGPDSLAQRLVERELSERSRPVDVNSAGLDRLVRLPGIGPELAGRIVAERARGGAFCDSADLATRVRGIGPASLGRLSGRLVFSDSLQPEDR